MVDAMILGDHQAAGLGRAPSPDWTHQAGYREHPMGTSHVLSPRWVSGDIALGTVWSRDGQWPVLTWLQAKWAESPEASDPWKEKWGEAGGGWPGPEEQERPTCTIPVGQERAPGTGTGMSEKRPR